MAVVVTFHVLNKHPCRSECQNFFVMLTRRWHDTTPFGVGLRPAGRAAQRSPATVAIRRGSNAQRTCRHLGEVPARRGVCDR